MFQYSLRDLMGLIVVAAFASLFGVLLAPPNSRVDVGKGLGVAVFGVGCYLAGISVGRTGE